MSLVGSWHGKRTCAGPLTVAAAETCLLSPRNPRPGLRRGGRTYPCKLAQCVLQHFHSEDESPLCQDLAVSIAQIFPAVTRGDRERDSVRNHRVHRW